MDAAIWVTHAGGAVRRADLTRAGISWRRVAAAVRAGDLIELGGGALAIPGVGADVAAAVLRSASLSCISALRHHGVDLFRPPRRVHLSGPRDVPDRQVEWHRGSRDGLAVDVARAAAQVLRCRPALDGLVAVDSLLRAERCTVAAIRAELPGRTGGHSRWVLEQATPLAGSVLESALRYHLLVAGIPGPVLQAPIAGVGRVDFLLAGWLVVETDGWETHGDRTSFEVDRRRDAAAAAQGFRTLRFTWEAIRHAPDSVVGSIRAVLATGPPSGLPVRPWSVTDHGDVVRL